MAKKQKNKNKANRISRNTHSLEDFYRTYYTEKRRKKILDKFFSNPQYTGDAIRAYEPICKNPTIYSFIADINDQMIKMIHDEKNPDCIEFLKWLDIASYEKNSSTFPRDLVGGAQINGESTFTIDKDMIVRVMFPALYYKVINDEKDSLFSNLSSEEKTKYKDLIYNVIFCDVGILDYIRAIMYVNNAEECDNDFYEIIDKLNGDQLHIYFVSTLSKVKNASNEENLDKAYDALSQLTSQMKKKNSGFDSGQAYYYEAERNYNKKNPDYNNAIKYASKVKKQDKEYYYMAVNLIAKSYAYLGDAKQLLEIFKNNPQIAEDIFYVRNLFAIAILQSRAVIPNSDLNCIIDYLGRKEKNNEVEEYGVYLQLVETTMDAILRIYYHYYDRFFYSDYFEDDKEIKNEVLNACSVLKIDAFFDSDFKKILTSKLSDKQIDEERLNQMKILISDTMINFVSSHQNQYYVIDLTKTSLEIDYKLGLIERFTTRINSLINEDAFRGSHRFKMLCYPAYIEESIRGDINQNLRMYFENELNADSVRVKNDENLAVLRKNLSKKSLVAFESAEKQFGLCETDDWGYADAGMLSLAYYRIIEVEFAKKIIRPIINMIGINRIKELYKQVLDSLSNDKIAGNKYKDAWNMVIEAFEKISNNNDDGMELGKINHFMKNLKNSNVENDVLFDALKTAICSLVIDSQRIDDFLDFATKTFLSYKVRNSYRNPPAHTKYLSYKEACGCREYVIENLQKFFDKLKETTV